MRYKSSVPRDRRGQALVDYALILLLTAAVVALVWFTMGSQIVGVLRITASTLQI